MTYNFKPGMVIEFDMLGSQTGIIKEIVINARRKGYYEVYLTVRDESNNTEFAIETQDITRIIEGENWESV